MENTEKNFKFKRILLKLSGEALMGDGAYGIDPGIVERLGAEIAEVRALGVEVAVVVGGGNIFRGEGLARKGMDRVTGDHMGMLATVINALALQDIFERAGMYVRVMSGLSIHDVCEDYIRRRAVRHLEKGRIVIFAAGTGNPFFTTDTAASLRAVEIGANLMLKATKVDGIYTADPKKDPNATRYQTLKYNDVLHQNLNVMDQTSIVLCRDNRVPMAVFDMFAAGHLKRIVQGDLSVCTYVD